jgi:DNA-binding IclR family transcriptional regulator
MISIGHKTHLFDTMSKLQQPATAEEISRAANLNEPYVKEWLGGMVIGQIVKYDPSTDKYLLPYEHATVLIRAAGIDNFAVYSNTLHSWI